MRISHPDTYLRRHGNPAGTYSQTEKSRREKRRNKGLRSSHSHWSQGAHTAKFAKPCKHYGKPRKPFSKRLEPRQKPHEPLLPYGQQGFPGGTQPQKAENHGGACGHLVRQSERGLRQVGALQREPLPFTKGTIEFRLFQFDAPCGDKKNGLHAGQLKSYIQLCLALSQLAKQVKTASANPQQTENPKYAMRTWLLRLGFIGDEFKTARELYTKRLEGDTAFRNGRP